ncbi:MAG: aminopeptidase P family protein [Bacteroidales bacterium]|nr:aminopeptidase P family protein [Bacteroidales bacterium]
MNQFKARVEAIRDMMRAKGWDVVVLTGNDPHNSEYSAPRWHQVGWVSGYTGEGDLVITEDHAGLWTDTRYFIQANAQLPGSGIELHKTRVQDQVLIPEWLSKQFENFDEVVVAVDGLGSSATSVVEIIDAIGRDRTAIANVPDMLSPLWQDRPDIPQTPIITLGTETVGWSRKQKIDWLRKWLADNDCDAILLTALDEIAWMLNVRGQDVAYNPVVMSYLLVTSDTTQWFVRKGPLPEDDHETEDSFYELTADGVNIQDYSDIGMALAGMVDDDYIKKLFVDPSTLNYDLYGILKENTLQDNVKTGKSPVALRKSVKNEVEIAGLKEAHLEDGLAMERFLYWLEKMIEGGEPLNEYECSLKLHEFRSEIDGFRGESFETISAYGQNAALPHYVTPESGSAELYSRGLYLNDSGGQYLFGTTDITRTVPLGPCTPLEKEDYTLVLKGHIALAKVIFPKGTAGCQLDVLAREPLWNSKRNFGHGTGHGVGFYLNVHEGPQEFRQNFNRQAFMPGMVTTDEPGIYREGKHGIRHENVLLCVDAGENDFGRWLKFETLTLCHFDTSIIVRDLLDDSEIKWLNDYNERVFRTLSPRLPSDIATWLRQKTLPI